MGRRPTDNKEKLLNAAIDLIWQNSYGHVSVDQICAVAAVNKGSFYHYFSSKLELTLAALDHFYDNSTPVFNDIFKSEIPPIERFYNFIDTVHSIQTQTKLKYGHVCGCPFMTLGSEMAGQELTIHKKINTLIESHKKYYCDTIEDMILADDIAQDTNAEEKATQLYAYIMGCVMTARIQNDLTSFKTNLEVGIFNILNINFPTKKYA